MNSNKAFTANVFSSGISWINELKQNKMSVETELKKIISEIAGKAIYEIMVHDAMEYEQDYTFMRSEKVSDCVLCDCIDLLRIRRIGKNEYICDEYVDDIKLLKLKQIRSESGYAYYELCLADHCGLYSKYDLIVEN